MSIVIKSSELSPKQVDQINEQLIIKIPNNKYNKFAPPQKIFPFEVKDNDYVHLPFAYAVQQLNLNRRPRTDFSSSITTFTGTLRHEQIIVKNEALVLLNKHGSCLISLYTGGGKTFLSINIASIIKLKTLIIVNKIVLMKQWNDSILKVCPGAKIQIISSSSTFQDCDFYIINAINVQKKSISFFKDIGTLILDECHLIMAEQLSKCMLNIYPRYLIGLSATPYRQDGLDPLLNFYFGENKIIRLLRREHIIYKVYTHFSPEVTLTKDGKINWSSLLDSVSNNKNRNELIIQIVKKFNDRNILILSKRVDQGNYLFNRLKEENEFVSSLIGKQQDFDRDARILVGTTSKCGTGFDFPKLDCLILATDIEQYYIQALGRVLRRPDVKPIVFDLIDDNKILLNHFKSRQKVYTEVGGKILDFNRLFPDFFTFTS